MEMQTQATMAFSGIRETRPSFLGIVRSELTKITWLRSTWVMSVLVLFLTAFIYLANAGEGSDLLKSDPIQYTYAFFLGQDLVVFRAITGYFALLITVFVVGLDYQFGTIRVILGRGVGRMQFLLGKIVALFIFALLILLVGGVLNLILLGVDVHMATGSFNTMNIILPHFVGLFSQYFLYLTLNLWVSILLAACVTVIGRSLTFGMSVALIWFPFDNIAMTLLAVSGSLLPGDILPKLSAYLLGPNLNVMPSVAISHHIPLDLSGALGTVSGLQTVVVALVYGAVFLVVALLLAQRRDVRS